MSDYLAAISLDVNAENNHKMIRAKQGDAIHRKIDISLLYDGQPFTPTGVSVIRFRIAKPDNTAVILASTDDSEPISVSDGVYTVILSAQCLAAAGRAKCDLALFDSDGNALSSANFLLDIIAMPDVGNLIESGNEWQELMEAIAEAEAFAQIVAFRVNNGMLQYTMDGSTWIDLTELSTLVPPITTAQINALFA